LSAILVVGEQDLLQLESTVQAKILSLDRLDDLATALAIFSTQAAEAVAAIRAELLRQQAELDRQEEDAQVEVSNRIEAFQYAADDDERESCVYFLAEAQERLSRIRGWQARVREEHSAFLVHAIQFARLLDQTLPKSQELLNARIGDLRTYGAVQVEPGVGAAATESASGPVPQPSGEVFSPRLTKLTEHRLPEGFVWVPLAEIDEAKLAGVASQDDYRKVPYTTMVTGLRRLAAEILPRINTNPDALDRDAFRHLDETARESYEDGLQRIYEAFFCEDFVYLERQRGQEKFEITNGRHRIRVAQDLGWEAIPARVKDLRS